MIKVLTFILFLFISIDAFSNPVLVFNDNGTARAGSAYTAGWEESVFLVPDGPCDVTEIYIYLEGNTPATDTIYFTGDPGDGALPGTFWVIAYNQRIAPVIIEYDGVPGWDTIKVNGLRSEGLDRICIQHRIQPGGPTFAMDNNGCSDPLRSYVFDPVSENTYGWPGIYYQTSGDYLVRMLVEYDNYDPEENTSVQAPPPTFTMASIEAGIVRDNGDPIVGSQITIADWNSDGFDDLSISSYKFENNGDGTFKDVTNNMYMPGFSMWTDYDSDGDLDSYVIREGKYVYDTTIVDGQEQIDSSWVQFDTQSYMTFSQNTIYRNDDGVFNRLDPKDVFLMPYPNPCDDFSLTDKYVNDSIHNPYICWGPVWTDYNHDGFPDLFLGNRRSVKGYPNEVFNPDQLWMNNGNGTFSRMTDSSNIGEEQKHKPGENRNQNNLYFNGQDASACDYNMDNNIDIHMINYGLERDFLWENQGDGTFNDVASNIGLKGDSPFNPNPNALTHGHACEWADFNNDGIPDVAVGNLAHPDWRGLFSNPSTIYKNNGPPGYDFTNVGPEMGLKFFESDCGVLWMDIDLDGWQDLWIGQRYDKMSHIYKNMGSPDFKLKEVSWTLGSLTYDKWTAARFDYDNDGDIDIMVAGLLFRNDVEHLGKWVNFRLEGSPADNVTTEAYGTKVVVHSGSKLFYRDLMGATSGPRHRQNSNELFFGLGDISAIDSVLVNYINGNTITLIGIETNSKYYIPYMEQAQRMNLATPALKSPTNHSTNIDETNTFIWEKCGGAENYQFQVSECSELSDALQDTCTTFEEVSDNTSLEFAGLVDTRKYYWRVRSIAGTDTSMWSSVWAFTVGYAMPDTPLLKTPANMADNVTPRTGFTWLESEVATNFPGRLTYNFQLSASENFDTIILDSTGIKVLSLQLEETLEPSTTYYWRVRCFHEDQPGEWSETWSYTTIGLPGTITLQEPENGAIDIDKRPTFEWEEAENAYKYHLIAALDEDFEEIFLENDMISKNTYRDFQNKCTEGTKFYWKVRGINDGGSGEWSDTWSFTTEGIAPSVEELKESLNALVSIENMPNPFDKSTRIKYILKKPARVSISIADANGRELFRLMDSEYKEHGDHSREFNSSGLPAGIYYCRLTADGYTSTLKMMVVR